MKIIKNLTCSVLTAFFMIHSVAATFTAENNITAKKTTHTISPGLSFISSVELNDGARQEIFTFEFTPGNDTKIAAAYGKYIYGFNSVGNLISSYDGEGRVVGGINTDFFITSTGIPLSCLISNDEIISSCDNRIAIGFDNDGNAKIGYPSIKAELVSADEAKVLTVAHINKTPGIWGLYLVTDKFYYTTKTSQESIEIVLMPIEEKSEDEIINSETYDITDDNSEGDSESEEIKESNVIIESFKDVEASVADNASESIVGSETIPDDIVSDSESEIEESGEKTSEDSVYFEEVEKDLSQAKLEELLKKYNFVQKPLEVNSTLKVAVTEIRESSLNGTIPTGAIVACIPKANYSYLADGITVGDEFTVKTSMSDEFNDCVNIFGAGTLIVEDSKAVPQENENIFKYKHPRTAAGIRGDGSVLFVCVDGRNAGISSGYTIKELSDYLISQGCVKAVNFDGGGSTTFYAADIGEIDAELKNSPSEGMERRVADGLIFVNMSEPTEVPAYASIYPTDYFVYNKGVTISINKNILFADSNFHPIEIDPENYTLSVLPEYGAIIDGIFISSGKTGAATVTATNIESGEFFDVGKILITDAVDKLNVTTDKSFISPYDNFARLDFSATLNSIPIEISNYSPEISISFSNGTSDDGTPLYTEVSNDVAFVDREKLIFVPEIKGNTYYITISLGGISKTLEIVTEAYPFNDMDTHWADRTAYDMYKSKLFIGEVSENGERSFLPDRNMTRAEFCAVLARILKLDTTLTEDNQYAENSSEYNTDDLTDTQKIEQKVTEETTELITESSTESKVAQQQSTNDFTDSDETNIEIATDSTEVLPEKSSQINDEITDTDNIVGDDNIEETESLSYELSDVPEWAKPSVYALYINGYINALISKDSEGKETINAEEYITRMDVIRVLGEIFKSEDEIPVDSEMLFYDFIPESELDLIHLYSLISKGIIKGYDDGTIRQNANLTRAEAATVFSRISGFDLQ